MKYLIVSCETSGVGSDLRNVSKLNKTHYYQPLSWGLMVVDEKFNKIDELYVELIYNAEYKPIAWEPSAQRIHQLTPIKLNKNGLNEIEAVEEIGSFIVQHFDLDKIVLVGYNVATFVYPFLDDMLKRYNIPLNFDYHMYDLNTVGLMLGTKNKAELFELLGATPKKRNSLNDVRAIHKCLAQIMKMWGLLLK
jgi:hypothetical protein